MHKQNQEVFVRSPAVVKLLGEHAVVYGKLCIAAAIDIYAEVKIQKKDCKDIEINFLDIPGYEKRQVISLDKIKSIYSQFTARENIGQFIESQRNESKLMLPCAVIIGEFAQVYGIDVDGVKITMSSKIPIQYGLASSAALSTALAVALSKLSKIQISNETVIEIARNGEKIVHENDNAGRIDVNTTFYGNIISYSTLGGAAPNKIDYELQLLLVDTGPKKPTAQMVANVAKLYRSDAEKTGRILDEIDTCSKEGLLAIRRRDIARLGELMYLDQELLKDLGVSSENIDRAVLISKSNKAYGAKLSGGGGGGMVLAIPQDKKTLLKALEDEGFKVSQTKISEEGAADYLAK